MTKHQLVYRILTDGYRVNRVRGKARVRVRAGFKKTYVQYHHKLHICNVCVL